MARGDAEALAALYRRHAEVMLAVARRILGSTALAEEALQQAFLQVWLRASSYDRARAAVCSWLVLIVRSRAIDMVRSRRARGEETTFDGEPPPACDGEGGFRRVLAGERSRRVAAALEQLPAAQRRVIELAYYSGLTQKEIASRERLPLGTVKTRTFVALRKLRRTLQPELAALL